MRRLLLPILAAVPLLTGACATTLDATKVGVPVTLAGQNAQPTPGAAFKVRKSAVYGLWGLATLGAPSLDRILATQLVGARQIADVRVKVRSRWSDVLFTVLTGGAEPFTVAHLGEARAWASEHGIDPARILFGSEPDSRVIPQHLLIGPDGRTWFRYIGQLQTEDMLDIFQAFETGLRLPNMSAKE